MEDHRYVVQPDGCWKWQMKWLADGYGRMKVDGKPILAHRYYYEQKYGRVPDGLELDHLCRNRWCCNPDHVEPVTHRENMLRAPAALATHCKQGHEWTEENTYYARSASGFPRRKCRKCTAVWQRAYQARKKASRG